ncbi:uncharacterized protein BJ212DRAFT_1446317 [Suillus subaureus]|uniref:CxC2-like cysteine cluster KDZ transposase-associated domain-containing protein n=1 Tax=Suillus subaureus TaxID=48587 RepID=A0A9P7EFI7_9AGAM|nr:uncharacterized protein BJ212DRAFT_1446317 [Suillus subaureus]KAG1819283.1 hypothetical protein BJ212DRAFT_1446317 [Suillus subaureus]
MSCSPSPENPAFDSQQDFGNAHLLEGADEAFMPEQGVQLGPLFRTFHLHLTGRKCDVHSNFIDQNALPPPRTEALPTDWTPYENWVAFETVEFLYTRNQMSGGQIDTLLDLWAATLIKHDDSPLGTRPAENVLPWTTAEYDVWFCNPCLLVHNMLSNPDFAAEIEYVPYRDYTDDNKHCYKNFLSGDWAWKQVDIITQDPETHGLMFVPLIIGSDKTTVSVATGHTEYHPLYLLIGNIFNGVQRAHCNGVVLVGFLAIPKSTKEHLDDKDFRNFCHQMFHSSLAKIFEPVKLNMMVPNVARCPNSHYQRVIYGLGPYITDYPEQVALSGVVQNWCPKCLNNCKNLNGDGEPLLQCRHHTDLMVQELPHAHLWHKYGIIQEVMPFMNDFPQADIHKLLSPDILHQIIKGTFKDHLVDWVEQYLLLTHQASDAAEIMDNIDQRIAVVAPFAGLQRFPEGCGFKQWTGDDSKALMKVYLPTISSHVPQDVVCAFSAFLDFCYIDDLTQLQDALSRFHQYCEIFKTTGVVLNFSYPCQHSLSHYSLMIQLFGAPNGLCSSITESKHIKAVKEPWHHSSRYKALSQMLLTNQCLDKIAAAWSDFEARGMLRGSCLSNALWALRESDCWTTAQMKMKTTMMHFKHVTQTVCSKFLVPGHSPDVPVLMLNLNLPTLPTLIQQFLHDQLHIDNNEPPEFDPAMAPTYMGRVSVFSSVAASFYAPSDLSGTGGMRCEHIQAMPSWQGGPARNDCVFVSMNDKVSYPDTGMYLVAPLTNDDGTLDLSIIHINCIFHAAHLIPLYGSNVLPRAITLHDSCNVFRAFYVNKYADHHAFEVV